jgi:hypothetical protein
MNRLEAGFFIWGISTLQSPNGTALIRGPHKDIGFMGWVVGEPNERVKGIAALYKEDNE